MVPAANDPSVPGYLGRALSLELSAVQLYTTEARLVGDRGMKQAAERFRDEAGEEMRHAERIITRMLAAGLAPGASQPGSVELGAELPKLLAINHRFEMGLVSLYQNAVSYCSRNGYHDDGAFFQALLEEEQAHADEMTGWIASLRDA